MKYLIISDIHGIKEYVELIPGIIERENPDFIILLGDILFHGYGEYDDNFLVAETLNLYKDKIIGIRGNNDTSYDQMELDFELNTSFKMVINNKLFFFTHGHIYSDYNIPAGVDVFVQGHTHKHGIKKQNNIIVANPGSISLPRGGSKHSYMTITDKLTIKDIDGNIIEEVSYE